LQSATNLPPECPADDTSSEMPQGRSQFGTRVAKSFSEKRVSHFRALRSMFSQEFLLWLALIIFIGVPILAAVAMVMGAIKSGKV
jgi:hypothetical protein